MKAFAKQPFVTTASATAKVHRTTVAYWCKHDPVFAEKVEAQRESWVDQVESAAFDRAVNGVESYVTCKDGLVYTPALDDQGNLIIVGAGDPVLDPVTGQPILDSQGNPVLSIGRPKMVPVTERKYSDSLAALILKSNRRDLYGDKQEIKHSGGVSMFGDISDDELDERIARAEARKAEAPLPE